MDQKTRIISFDDVRKNEDVKTYILRADETLIALGYTEHAFMHVEKTARTAGQILIDFGCSERGANLPVLRDICTISKCSQPCGSCAKRCTYGFSYSE
jgi:hypothetical protein